MAKQTKINQRQGDESASMDELKAPSLKSIENYLREQGYSENEISRIIEEQRLMKDLKKLQK